MKTAFYFRTQKEFNDMWEAVEKVDHEARTKYNFGGKIVRVKSRYLGNPKADRKENIFIPYREPSKKKYIGVIVGNKHQLNRADIDPVEIIKEQGLERVQHADNEATYRGELSKCATHLTTHTQLSLLVSMLDTQFGSGNWGIHGPKRLNKKLLEMEKCKNDYGEGFMLKRQFPKGIPVEIVVKKEDVDVGKYIFKLALMI